MSNALREAMQAVDQVERPAAPAASPLMDLNALRAIAHNAVYEAMLMRGRVRFSPLDALRADIIFRALADTPASDAADLVRTAVIPADRAGTTAMLANMAQAIEKLEPEQVNDGGESASAGQAA